MKQKGRKEKMKRKENYEEKIINVLQRKVSEMSNELETLENILDRKQQYSRRNCIFIHWISKRKGEDKDEQALNLGKQLKNPI